MSDADAQGRGVPGWLTMRSAVFVVVLLVAAVLVVPTLRQYLIHEQGVAQLRDRVSAAEAERDQLAAQLARWDDDAYVKAQARGRLGYLVPGEKAYRVLDPEVAVKATPTPAPDAADSAVAPDKGLPWYLAIADSAEGAAAESDRAEDAGEQAEAKQKGAKASAAGESASGK